MIPAESTTAGKRTVNTEPLPGSLDTSMSPPIIRQKWRVMTSPSPLPPYFRVVDASAWLKALNNRLICSADMPMPESDTWNW